MKIERFEDIEAWQLAHKLTGKVYHMTKKVQFARDYELKGQIQAASGSSMHNIAEGFDSGTNAEFITLKEFNEVYEYAGRTRAAVHGFIKYLKKFADRKTLNPEP